MTAGQLLVVLMVWAFASVPAALLIGHFIGFGAENSLAKRAGAYAQAPTKAA